MPGATPVPWQAEVLAVIKDIVEVQKEEKENELKTSFLTQKLWHLIYSHTKENSAGRKKRSFYLHRPDCSF